MSQQTLIIRLTDLSAATIDWALLDEQHKILQSQHKVTWDNIKPFVSDTPVKVIIPTQYISLYYLPVPKTSPAKLRVAVPYLLEEQLVADIDDLHFAIGAIQDDGCATVAVIEKTIMQNLIALLNQHQLIIEGIYIELLCLPQAPQQANILVQQSIAHVHLPAGACFSCDLDNLALLIKAEKDKLLQDIQIYYQETAPSLDINSAQIRQQKYDKPMPLLTGQQAMLNLLQGEFKPKKHYKHLKNTWRYAAIAATAWFAIMVSSIFVEWAVWGSRASHLNQQVTKSYRQIFPHASSIVAPKVRIQQKIQQLRANQNGGSFLLLLATAGSVLHHMPTTKILQMNYQNDQLILMLQADNFVQLRQIERDLQQHHIKVKQDSAHTDGKFVKARFTLQEMSS